ncbi:MAG: hypothetical protein RL154_1440 [Pseudomonadota bacterium]|jgi:hypothetical protein
MDNFHLEATKHSPLISLDATNGTLTFKGKSYPENTFMFYEPVLNWTKEYFKSPKSITTVEFEITYFNSSSSKLFFDYFDILEKFAQNGCNIVVNWIYDEENETALEAGEDFKDDFEVLNFNLVAVQN